jgi:hypothetical protein
MGTVADQATYNAAHYRGTTLLSIELEDLFPFGGEDSLPRLAHLRHNPPAQGQHVIRFRKMGRIH